MMSGGVESFVNLLCDYCFVNVLSCPGKGNDSQYDDSCVVAVMVRYAGILLHSSIFLPWVLLTTYLLADIVNYSTGCGERGWTLSG